MLLILWVFIGLINLTKKPFKHNNIYARLCIRKVAHIYKTLCYYKTPKFTISQIIRNPLKIYSAQQSNTITNNKALHTYAWLCVCIEGFTRTQLPRIYFTSCSIHPERFGSTGASTFLAGFFSSSSRSTSTAFCREGSMPLATR